jgi:hypothetical protein
LGSNLLSLVKRRMSCSKRRWSGMRESEEEEGGEEEILV